MIDPAQLRGWIPIRFYWRENMPWVDWCYLDDLRLTEPFFEQTITARLRHPFHLVFRRQTPAEAMLAFSNSYPGVQPRGFIFHMSRCGSTLLAQMLAALPQHIVISEASPIDEVLGAHLRHPAVSDEQRIAWLRALVGAIGQRRYSEEQHLFIKFDSWHTLDLPLVRRAFPDVPWLFLYRDPIEVMVSHARQRGSQMVPGLREGVRLGADLATTATLSLDEYCARVLANTCQTAIDSIRLGGGRVLNYHQLPDAVPALVQEFFGVRCGDAEIEQMRQVARFHAKQTWQEFQADSEDKQRSASDSIRRLAEQWLRRPYEQLEALRDAQQAAS